MQANAFHSTAARRGKSITPIRIGWTKEEPVATEQLEVRQIPAKQAITPPALSKRSSRGILGLFSRNKTVKELPKPTENVRRSNLTQQGSLQRTVTQDPIETESNVPHSIEAPQKLSYSQALAQAAKHATLTIPTIDADSILKYQRQREELQSLAEEDEEDIDSIARKYAPEVLVFNWQSGTFILTQTGLLLQYSSIGWSDRLPERFIQLTNESAAFASDAVPGKHWVLHVTRSFNEQRDIALPRSRFSKMAIRPSKHATNNMLLVMDSAKDMELWLAAVRKAIIFQGSDTYQSGSPTFQKPTNVKQQLRARPSLPVLLEKSKIAAMPKSPMASVSYNNTGAALAQQEELMASWSSSRRMSGISQASVGSSFTSNSPTVSKRHSIIRHTPPASPPPDEYVSDESLLYKRATAASTSRTTPVSPNSAFEVRASRASFSTTATRPSIVTTKSNPNFSCSAFSHRFSQALGAPYNVHTPPHSAHSSRRPSSPNLPAKESLADPSMVQDEPESESELEAAPIDNALVRIPTIITTAQTPRHSFCGTSDDPESEPVIIEQASMVSLKALNRSFASQLNKVEISEDAVETRANPQNVHIPARLSSLHGTPISSPYTAAFPESFTSQYVTPLSTPLPNQTTFPERTSSSWGTPLTSPSQFTFASQPSSQLSGKDLSPPRAAYPIRFQSLNNTPEPSPFVSTFPNHIASLYSTPEPSPMSSMFPRDSTSTYSSPEPSPMYNFFPQLVHLRDECRAIGIESPTLPLFQEARQNRRNSMIGRKAVPDSAVSSMPGTPATPAFPIPPLSAMPNLRKELPRIPQTPRSPRPQSMMSLASSKQSYEGISRSIPPQSPKERLQNRNSMIDFSPLPNGKPSLRERRNIGTRPLSLVYGPPPGPPPARPLPTIPQEQLLELPAIVPVEFLVELPAELPPRILSELE